MYYLVIAYCLCISFHSFQIPQLEAIQCYCIILSHHFQYYNTIIDHLFFYFYSLLSKLGLHLPHPVHCREGKAQFFSDRAVLEVSLLMNRPMDSINLQWLLKVVLISGFTLKEIILNAPFMQICIFHESINDFRVKRPEMFGHAMKPITLYLNNCETMAIFLLMMCIES